MQRCVLASGNAGKLKELADALADFNIEMVSQTQFNIDEADETAVTFVENALIKARHASEATGLPALADDSGLVVNALGGEPGIYSARYAATDSHNKPTDAENIEKLLNALQHHSDRSAYFVCVLALVKHANDPEPLLAIGRWHGRILEQPAGAGGFGYDPVFYCLDTDMSAAEMGAQKKRAISHRARALTQLRQLLG
ncbi:MAG: RdgB/HAM1 family non-canonical purine NTP pyrophosphatase [Pseudomonadota bacterium]